ncbi:MAG: M28 family peptidase [Caldilineaceae bacterium]|nr:M28 family peptidase [Caldilineaceae bacterium]
MMTTPFAHLFHLAVEIGQRPGGSAGNLAAADYIEGVFRSCGLAVERQRFACTGWEAQDSYLQINEEWVQSAANVFSPPCDVSGAVTAVSTLAELEAADLRDKIALLYGDLTRHPLPAKAWAFKEEKAARVVELLEEKEPAALITVQSRFGDLERVIEDADFTIPSATVPAQVGLRLLKRYLATVHLRIASTRTKAESYNVVARHPGAGAGTVLICAHYDTKFDTPGAADNGSGVAVLLTLAQMLSQQIHPHALEFVAFSNEEYLPLGNDAYFARHNDSFDEMLAVINIDKVGCTLGNNSITTLSASEPFQEHLAAITRSYPGVVWVEPWIESDHAFFAWRGVPCVPISNGSAPHFDHLRGDTIEWISAAKLNEAASLVHDIVADLQRRPVGWGREPKCEEVGET